MKECGICEKQVREMIKSCKTNVLGFIETSTYSQTTSSTSLKYGGCRSLSFGWV